MTNIIDELFEWVDNEGYMSGDELKGAIKLTIRNHFTQNVDIAKLNLTIEEYKSKMEEYLNIINEKNIKIASLHDQLEVNDNIQILKVNDNA